MNGRKWPCPIIPTPMNPIVTRLLGATAPSRPNTDEGTMVGKATDAPATAAAPFKNSRRLIFALPFMMPPYLTRRYLMSKDPDGWGILTVSPDKSSLPLLTTTSP